MRTGTRGNTTRPRIPPWLDVLQRALAAVPAGYGMAYLFTAALPRLIGGPRTEAVLWASMASFALYLCLIIYAFAEPSLIRLWLLFGVLAAGLGAIVMTTTL